YRGPPLRPRTRQAWSSDTSRMVGHPGRHPGEGAAGFLVLAANCVDEMPAPDRRALGGSEERGGDSGVADEPAGDRIQGGELAQADVGRDRGAGRDVAAPEALAIRGARLLELDHELE